MNRKVSIVAEAGTSHQGSISAAEALIAAAKQAGADIIKFQYVIADEIVHPLAGKIKLPGGLVAIYDQFKKLECSPDFYVRLIELCRRYEIGFLCTPFGLESAGQLHQIGVNLFKIASPELNHTPLLREVASYGIPVILSSGVSRSDDLRYAVSMAKNTSVILHCVTSYPAPEEEYNLNILPEIKKLFGKQAGVSDHSLHPFLVPALAVSRGAVMIEKHFTLSRQGTGLDDPIALDQAAFSELVRAVRQAETEQPEAVLHEYEQRFGSDKVRAILGTGKKQLAPSEKANYHTTRRSVLAVHDIRAGETADYLNCGIYRSEKNLIPGMEPACFEAFAGRVFQKKIPAGGPVLESCF
ncbi:MAG: N-acetylneuraminate synthase family protein [Spirochaetales bacterium]|nr:N-acetylneuraminate synthase family protein [Spirochaetales bacterium]